MPYPTATRANEAGRPDRTHFRTLMSQWPTGVTVVTTHDRDGPTGCTVSAMLSLSDTPPLVVVSLLARSNTLRAIQEHGSFAITVLSARQEALCADFAALPSGQRFRNTPVRFVRGVPLPGSGVASMICDVDDVLPYADHALIVGAPAWNEVNDDVSPLLIHRREFRTVR